jgi:hypothetical protein
VLWRQRWAHAEQVLSEQGVVLRSWRVGSDIMDEAVGIIQDAEKRFKRDEEKLEQSVREDGARNGGKARYGGIRKVSDER